MLRLLKTIVILFTRHSRATVGDFKTHEEWSFARIWANKLLVDIGEQKRGYDSTGEVTIFTED